MLVARNLARLRVGQGLTQEQFAVRCGLSSSTIRRLEHGAGARPATMQHIASVLGVSEFEIYGVTLVDDEDAEPALA